MKFLILFALFALALARPGDHYDSKYDNFDVDELLANKRLLKAYILCFLGEGKCTAEGNEFKTWIPDAVQTSCGKCTDKQKGLVARVINASKVDYPELWEKLNNLHNPEGKYTAALDKFLADNSK